MAEIERRHRDHFIQMPQPPHPPPLPPQTYKKKSVSTKPRGLVWWDIDGGGVHQILLTLDGDFVAFQNVYHSEQILEQRRMSAFGPDVHQLIITVDVEHIIASKYGYNDDLLIPGPRRMWADKPGAHQLLVTLNGEQFVAYQNVYDNQVSVAPQKSASGRHVRLLITVDGKDSIADKCVDDNETISGSPSKPMPNLSKRGGGKPVAAKKYQKAMPTLKNRGGKLPVAAKNNQKTVPTIKNGGGKPPVAVKINQNAMRVSSSSSSSASSSLSSLSSSTWTTCESVRRKKGEILVDANANAMMDARVMPWLLSPPPLQSVLPPPAPPSLPWKRTGLRRPSTFYLWEKQIEKYVKICSPLCNAALEGNWHDAEAILKEHPEVINMSITRRQDTVLHIVASTKHTHFAQKLVNMMRVEDLELQNRDEETALCVAVASTVEMVDVMLNRNNGLIKIRKNGDLPFVCAVFSGDKDMARHIYYKTNLVDGSWKYSDKKRLLDSCVAFGLLDIAVEIFNKFKDKRTSVDTLALRSLAFNPSAFDGTRRPIIRRLVDTILRTSRIGPLDDSKAAEIVRIMLGEIVKKEILLNGISVKSEKKNVQGLQFAAARSGNYKFIIEILRFCPDLTWETDVHNHTIFHIAVLHRQENVYNLLYETSSKKLGTTDYFGNNILHLAALMPAQDRLNMVSGAALQMQRELLWFKEVQTRLNSIDRIKVNYRGKSPQALFTDEHAKLMKKGEIWMKETAAQCMVVAALIATIMFAAAFTLPGGNNQNSGHPILMKKSAFIVFVVTDAISLCTASASLLMFLAILTSRYTENDFMVSLPVKLMVGLITLFISIANMMIAFSASCFLLYAKSMKWIPVLVCVLAGLPVILFVGLQSHLLSDVFYTTFNSRHLFRPQKRMLY